MKDLLVTIVKGLVEKPEQVTVEMINMSLAGIYADMNMPLHGRL